MKLATTNANEVEALKAEFGGVKVKLDEAIEAKAKAEDSKKG
ncbi:hypothetical protein BCU25_022480 [Vibrio cyclitrophicus]